MRLSGPNYKVQYLLARIYTARGRHRECGASC